MQNYDYLRKEINSMMQCRLMVIFNNDVFEIVGYFFFIAFDLVWMNQL